MKRKFPGQAKYALIFFVISLAGCHKFIDWDDAWNKHNPDCRVKKITYQREFSPETVTGVFNYNHKGNPTTVVFDYVSTARPNFVFRYDHKGRLTDFIAPYENENYELWYQYQYDHKGRIISDTLNVFGSYIDSVPAPSTILRHPGFYEYDLWGRISKITRYYPQNTVIVETYEYNGDGNLQTMREFTNGNPSGVSTYNNYDNKVNINRTNKIWMFLNRDYSKNNREVAATYNSKGLPTQYNLPGFFDLRFLHETYIAKSEIEYQCK